MNTQNKIFQDLKPKTEISNNCCMAKIHQFYFRFKFDHFNLFFSILS